MTRAAARRSAARRTPASVAALSSFPRHPETRSSSPHPPRTETARLCVSGPTDASLESHRRSPPPSLDAREDSLSSEASPPCPSASPESAATSTRSSAAASSSAAAACTSGSGCAVASSTAAAARGPTAAASKKTSSVGLSEDSRTTTAAVRSRHVHSAASTDPSIADSADRSACTIARRSELGESSLACRRIARRAAVSTSRVPHADAAATAATCASTSLDATPRARESLSNRGEQRSATSITSVASPLGASGFDPLATYVIRSVSASRRVTDDRDGFGSVSAAAMAGASAAERRHVSAVAAAGARSSAREHSESSESSRVPSAHDTKRSATTRALTLPAP